MHQDTQHIYVHPLDERRQGKNPLSGGATTTTTTATTGVILGAVWFVTLIYFISFVRLSRLASFPDEFCFVADVPITGDHSKQDLRCTQKPTYLPIFTNNIWSY